MSRGFPHFEVIGLKKTKKSDIISKIHAMRMCGMGTSEAQKKAVAKYQSEKTDLIKFRVDKGKKAEYQALAERSGAKSLTAYITSLLEEKLKEEQ